MTRANLSTTKSNRECCDYHVRSPSQLQKEKARPKPYLSCSVFKIRRSNTYNDHRATISVAMQSYHHPRYCLTERFPATHTANMCYLLPKGPNRREQEPFKERPVFVLPSVWARCLEQCKMVSCDLRNLILAAGQSVQCPLFNC